MAKSGSVSNKGGSFIDSKKQPSMNAYQHVVGLNGDYRSTHAGGFKSKIPRIDTLNTNES